MTDHPDFAVGDLVYRLRPFAPWEYEPEQVEVTGYDPVTGNVFWRRGAAAGFGHKRLFVREKPDD